MEAHAEEMERLTFDAILKDQAVRRIISRRDVLNAFYNIKQKGNAGAHADESVVFTADDAIDVLSDLHYVTGEMACKYGLIKSYPSFDKHIGVYPGAKAIEEEDINEQVKKMYAAFVAKYEEQELIENLEESDIRYAVEGTVDMHEYLIFEERPAHESTKKYVQNYLCFLAQMASDRSSIKKPDIEDPVELRFLLTINNSDKYSSDDPIDNIAEGISRIVSAESIEIDIHLKGNLKEYYEAEDAAGNILTNLVDSRSFWNGSGMYEELLSRKRREKFIYKQITLYPDAGEFNCLKIQSGKDYTMEELLNLASTDIITSHPSDCWFSWIPSITFEFDFEKYPRQLELLKETGRKHMQSNPNVRDEGDWIDIDDDEAILFLPQLLNNLNDLQNYLDDINELLYEFDDFDDFDYYIPIMQSAGSGYSPTALWISEDGFAVATVKWMDDELKVVGTEF